MADETRELWSWNADGEPVAGLWWDRSEEVDPRFSLSRRIWSRTPQSNVVAAEGELVFPTREAAVRHEIAETRRHREVLVKGVEELDGKIRRLTAMLEGSEKSKPIDPALLDQIRKSAPLLCPPKAGGLLPSWQSVVAKLERRIDTLEETVARLQGMREGKG